MEVFRHDFRGTASGINRRPTGFTLLELLVALLIGSIVIAVVGGLFLANTNTFRAVDDASRLQENGRFALQTVSRIARQAGFVPVDVSQLVATQNDAYPDLMGFPGAKFVAGTNGTGSNNSDSLTVAFFGAQDANIVDCSGTQRGAALVALGTAPTTLPPPVTNTFFVAPANSGVGFSLWCGVTVAGTSVGPPFELITGVESFQVLYAVDAVIPSPTGGAGTRNFAADYITSANNLTGAQFNSVLGVQVAIVLRGSETATLDAATAVTTLRPFGATYTGSNGDPDGAIYTIAGADQRRTFRLITSTINLRNRAA